MASSLVTPFLFGLLACAVRADVDAAWQTWGPYRPGLYFGVRPQIPNTLLMGLMWAGGGDDDRDKLIATLRDTCEQDDGVAGYGWTVYDPRAGGSQAIYDDKLGVNLTTEFVKNEFDPGWAVRVSGVADRGTKTSVIVHFAIQKAMVRSVRKKLECRRVDGGTGHVMGAECGGRIEPELGSFELRVNSNPTRNTIRASRVRSVRAAEDKIWQAKTVLTDLLKAPTSKDDAGAGNMHFVQFDFEGSFDATVSYRDAAGLHLSPDAVVEKVNSLETEFPVQMDRAFPRAPAYQDGNHTAFVQALLSNLLGGLGFFHGDAIVDTSKAPEYQETDLDFWTKAADAMSRATPSTAKATSLLSFTPSRPFFARGFLWDEGFHLLPVIEWDMDLAVSVLRSWLGQMDDDGWIAREQILGPEARSRVPAQFHTQYPHHANPPTLIALVLPAMLARMGGGAAPYRGHASKLATASAERMLMLEQIYPSLKKHYDWFRRTQAGNFSAYARPPGAVAHEGYRWRGRTPMHTLASGLDDYPRASPPHPGELHVDALAWVGASAAALLQLAEHLGEKTDAAVFREHLEHVQTNLDAVHWSQADGAYCDTTVTESGKFAHACHLGYVSLFPLLLGLMNATHPRLPAVLDLVADTERLWSPHGLRSLSAADPLHGKGEDYWRGAVWMNLNVLAVLRLRDIGLQSEAAQPGRALALASKLRDNVVRTVFESYQATGFVWEQYDDRTGAGRHSRAFTGWTACVVLLMGLEFPASGRGDYAGGLSSGVMSSRTLILSVVVVVGLMAFKRRSARLTSRVANFWPLLKGDRERGRYEVIDLDER